MISISRIAQWCQPWNHLFSHSKMVSGSVTGAHIIALMFAGGLAIASDRLTLRARGRDRVTRLSQLRDVAEVHGAVLIGILVLFVSGVLLAAADVETFLPSPYFWVKLSLVVMLLINGAWLTTTERTLRARPPSDGVSADEEALWSRVRTQAIASVSLWTATAVAGIVLSNAA
jgi:hypothetical protein